MGSTYPEVMKEESLLLIDGSNRIYSTRALSGIIGAIFEFHAAKNEEKKFERNFHGSSTKRKFSLVFDGLHNQRWAKVNG